ncbi:MAG TPA: ribonucleoside triphosphate reductase, partial [Clostridiaceae bacterium]|nr:ribonucleoside triphosphate reductase [Clostridiaceae bacterium]
EAFDFAKRVLNHMRNRLTIYQEAYGDLYNLEATPAESTAYRLAKHDVKRYPDIQTANENNGTVYYTNSSHLPVGYTADIFTALDYQDELQTLYTSGTVFHAFLGEKLPDWEAAAKLVRKIAENYALPYYTLSPTYSVCKDHGYIVGEQFNCPTCGEKTEVYSRITGYYRPVQNWNDGKAQEYKERKLYDLGRSHLTHGDPKTCVNQLPTSAVAANASEPLTLTEDIRHSTKGIDEILATKNAAEENLSDGYYLFTTQTCPHCSFIKKMMDAAHMNYHIVDAQKEADLTARNKIMQAPTLLKIQQGESRLYAGSGAISQYIHTAFQ